MLDTLCIKFYPVVHVQYVYFIHSSACLFSSKQHNTRRINLCESEPCTGRGPGTSGLRGAPSGYRVEDIVWKNMHLPICGENIPGLWVSVPLPLETLSNHNYNRLCRNCVYYAPRSFNIGFLCRARKFSYSNISKLKHLD